ncbi:MAG: 23S rRNA (cytidine(2498)-2'-O)-methyltransferase RlmM, partial [Gallionellaceae bacterium]|nr:23S rRNA (cytidine(2498)-2'-O)-methyltransferase RlmM [Gallionellaceae bacterium]
MNTPHTQQWLIYCRAGFERDCVEETQAKPIEAIENSGFVVLQGKPRLDFSLLAFARQLISLHGEVKELPEKDRLTPLLAAIPSTPEKFSALFLEVPDSNEGKMLSGFTRRFQPLLEAKLRETDRLVDDKSLPRLHLFFPDKTRALIGTSEPHNSCDALNGIHRVSMAHDAPSRSYLKLAEAFEVFLDAKEKSQLLKPNMTAVDLGAAPGGWTWQLVQRGFKVTAVDNGPLKGAAAAHASIKHLRKDGFSFRPQRPVDWLVCDMVEQPQRVATLMAEWFVNGLTQHAIFNLK